MPKRRCPDCGCPDSKRGHRGAAYVPDTECKYCGFDSRIHQPLSTVLADELDLPPGVKFGPLENVYRRPDGRFDFLPDEPN